MNFLVLGLRRVGDELLLHGVLHKPGHREGAEEGAQLERHRPKGQGQPALDSGRVDHLLVRLVLQQVEGLGEAEGDLVRKQHVQDGVRGWVVHVRHLEERGVVALAKSKS